MQCVLLAMLLVADPPYAIPKPTLEPAVFADGVISTADFESHPHFSADGRTLYFVKSTPQFSDWKIYVSKYENGAWSKPEFAPFSGKYRDADPFITADGKRFFFISDRRGPGKTGGDMDIWYMDAVKGGWGAPKRLGSEVNTPDDEWFPTVTKDGTLYFGSPRAGTRGGCDIWYSKPLKGRYGEAINAGPEINTEHEEIEPFISMDGNLIVFNAVRPTGMGGLDFYVATRSGGKWSAAKHLDARFNSKAAELSPKMTPDGKYFLFTKVRGRQRLGDIMIVDVRALKE